MIRDEDLDELLTRKQAVELMPFKVATFDRLVAAGEIEVIRPSGRGTRGRIYVTRRALLDYLNRARQPAKPSR